MQRSRLLIAALASSLICGGVPVTAQNPSAQDSSAQGRPPVAAKKPHQVVAPHGAARDDEYYWLRDDRRQDPDVLAHLRAENAYADHVLAPTRPLQEQLFAEFVGRVQQDDVSVPYRWRGHWYYARRVPGKGYAVSARRKDSMENAEEIVLDYNLLADGKTYFRIGDVTISPDTELVAYTDDTVGRAQYVLRFKNLATGETLADTIENVDAAVVWANDNRTVFYVENDPVTLTPKAVKAHVVGAPTTADRLIYAEQDPSFKLSVARTRSDKFVCIAAASTDATEQRCTSADQPGEFSVLAPRTAKHAYSANHHDGRWVIRTNWDAPNGRLMTMNDDVPLGDRARWDDLLAPGPDVTIRGFQLFDGFVAVTEYSDALARVRILADRKSTFIASDEPAYAMQLAANAEPGTAWVRYMYGSLTTPNTLYEMNVRTGERRLLKRDPVPGYDPAGYVTERLFATARDGAKIPVSLVYRKGLRKDGSAALLQSGYGAYGALQDPTFYAPFVSLLDRGMVYAFAHVRGGSEMGRSWYENGRQLAKRNTFTDFIDVTRFLVKEGYAAKERVAALGGSAGGLLVAAVANMAPDEYRAIVAQVPFVDIVTTMLDDSIPLTQREFEEWGDPKQKPFYDYMLSYSPYDNVERKNYPAMFVGTGLFDDEVQYFEPAKWVARLRDRKTDANPLVMRINMEAGHSGTSGRFAAYRERAEVFAFVLSELKVAP
jgi:oligopeptidase B